MRTEIRQGESHTITYELVTESGGPKDLTLYGAEWRLVPRFSEDPLITKTLGAGIEYTDAAAGLLEVHLLPEDTELDPGSYRHELRLTSSENAHSVGPEIFIVSDSIYIPG